MPNILKSSALALGIGLAIQTAHAEGAPDRDFPHKEGYVSAPEQHRAISDCHYKLGKRGYPKLRATYVAYPWGGDTVMRILPDRRVSPNDAAWINACADAKLGRATDTVVRRVIVKRVNGCPKHAPTLYGGVQYCIGN
ncbi:hypothetical protein ACEWPM_013930 [Roseovarius sp. S4756]|uniref:hypothetical protein n=1 Tax=Roseovarius maritimus TaxID=3342637 RepID=UPI0037262111